MGMAAVSLMPLHVLIYVDVNRLIRHMPKFVDMVTQKLSISVNMLALKLLVSIGRHAACLENDLRPTKCSMKCLNEKNCMLFHPKNFTCAQQFLWIRIASIYLFVYPDAFA